ncbi:MAG TPA: hypothetical protein LFV91_05070 [Rickettsia endosymbiont of Bembidion nr. Transversale]|nr:hypothetical protein [Rickettsia endosymbiont of Bembidion nr. Transversale]
MKGKLLLNSLPFLLCVMSLRANEMSMVIQKIIKNTNLSVFLTGLLRQSLQLFLAMTT